MNDTSHTKYFPKIINLNEQAYESNIFRFVGMGLMSMLYAYSLQPVLINQHCSEYE